MDYLKIYNSIYNKTYGLGEIYIKHKLIQFNKDVLTFERASNLIRESVDNFGKKNSIHKEPKLYELKNIYQKSLSNYKKNEVELSLKNEVRKGYAMHTLDIQNTEYTIELFIKELAILNAINELLRLFNNHSSLFKMMYDNDYFDLFEIVDYDPIDFRDSKIYIELLNKFYPLRQSSQNYSAVITDDIIDDSITEIDDFNEKEKAFLLHSIYKIIENSEKSSKLNNTEFYKVLSIVNLKDNSCFVSDNYKNSDYYRILSGGIEKVSIDVKTQDSFIDILIKKTRELKLKNITKYLSQKSTFLKAEIARNSNKTKKQ